MTSCARGYSGMKLPPRLAIILIVCLIAIALPAAPAQADGATITLSPTSEVPGENVTVYGYNFTPSKYIDIYYDVNGDDHWTSDEWMTDVAAGSGGNFHVTFQVPESYKGTHTVRAQENSSSGYVGDAVFTVKPGLRVSPPEGPVGTTVHVEGVGFAEDEEDIQLLYYSTGSSEVIKDDIPADEDGSWQYSFQIPPSARGSHRIDASGETSTFSAVEDATFGVTPDISLDRSSGSPGEGITMMGTGFYGNDGYIKILFEDVEVPTEPDIIRADEIGSWNGTFEVPEMPTAEYSVTAEGQHTKDVTALTFEIEAGIVLSPDQGHVGTNVTVTGGGFATNKNVVIKYDGSQVGAASTDAEGSFSGVTFPAPGSQHGARQVTAEVDGEIEATANFTMESQAPDVPDLVAPPDESRVGIMGSVTPTFEWSAVSDPSGVRYSLQIATTENVSATGEFADPIVSIGDIVGTNYTLNATDALPYGTYYWIVQAVDRAENAGDWTAARSFRAGLLPLWAFIVAIVAVAAGIGAAVYFFVIRRRIYYY